MAAVIIRLAERGRPYKPHAATFDHNWWLAEYAAAYARLFGGLANAWGETARKLRAADVLDGLPSDCEPPDGAA